MFRLPIIDTAQEGFRVTREQPLAVLAWGVWFLLSIVLGQMLLTLPGMRELGAIAQTPYTQLSPAQTAQMAAAVARVWPAMLATLLVSYGFAVVSYTAIMRAVFDPAARDRLFFLRLGRDEGLQLLLGAFVAVVLVGYATLVQVLFAVAASLGPVAGPPLAAFVLAAAVATLVVVWLRLSLAPAATFAARRLRLFGTWPLTRGLSWPLLGVYASAFGLAAVIFFLLLLIVEALTATLALAEGGGVDAIRAMHTPDTSSLQALFAWPSLVAMLISAAITTPLWVITSAAGVAAYRRIAAARGEPAAR